MDYTSGPYSVTFLAGVTSVPFNISINDDNILEENENLTFTINSSLPTGVMVGSPDQATVTIVDNDRKLSHDIYYATFHAKQNFKNGNQIYCTSN